MANNKIEEYNLKNYNDKTIECIELFTNTDTLFYDNLQET